MPTDAASTFFARIIASLAATAFFVVSVPAGLAQTTVQEWQAKAVQDYPALAVPNSELNLKFRSKLEELKRTNPDFFKDPKWPYALAQSLDPKSQVISGVDVTSVPGNTNSAPPPATSTTAPAPYRTARVENYQQGSTSMRVYSAQTVADLVKNRSLDTPQGQTICIEGTVARQYSDALANPNHFYAILAPNVACEFQVEGFVNNNYRYVSKFSTADIGRLDVRLKEDQATLYQAMGYHSWGYQYNVNKGYKAIKPILVSGEQVSIVGQVEGFGKIGAGVNDCVILRNCSIRRTYGN